MFEPRKEKNNYLKEFKKLQEQNTDSVLNFFNHKLGNNHVFLFQAIHNAEELGLFPRNFIETASKYATIKHDNKVTLEEAKFAVGFHRACKILMLEK